jgi:hypothetical protein
VQVYGLAQAGHAGVLSSDDQRLRHSPPEPSNLTTGSAAVRPGGSVPSCPSDSLTSQVEQPRMGGVCAAAPGEGLSRY